MKLSKLIATRIAEGLQRKSINSCSKWTQMYRMMGSPFPGLWSFKYHPWLKLIHDTQADLTIGQKSAQMGFTEVALNKSFYAIDIEGKSVLYVLPATTPDAGDFSTARFDPALEMSSHLSNMFSDVQNIGHKRAGNCNLYVRGSRSRSQLKSLPAGLLIFDEVDEMIQDNIVLAFERSSGQLEKEAFMLSTPTIDNYGVNKYYKGSSQNHFFFKCPRCSRLTELTFPECLVITADSELDIKIKDSYLICKECKGLLDHSEKPNWLSLENTQWVESYTDRMSVGFHINQLYSNTIKPYELAVSYLNSQTNATDEQEFYNSKLGLTHVVKGARVTDTNIEDCIKKYHMSDTGYGFTTMGIDVGTWLHLVVEQWTSTGEGVDVNLSALPKTLCIAKLRHFEELDEYMRKYAVNFAVIDGNPERRKSFEFASRFFGIAKMCFYGNNLSRSKQINVHPDEEQSITVDRTSWLDMSLGRIIRGKAILPVDTPIEYKDHLKSLVRVYKKDATGNPVGSYVNTGADHFAHARNYSEIALTLGVNVTTSTDIVNPT